MTTLAEVRERHESMARERLKYLPREWHTYPQEVEQIVADRAFLLAEVDRLKALCGRYINHVYEREGADFLSPVHARGVFTDSEITELREAAK